jgi:predicted transcriptional regulator
VTKSSFTEAVNSGLTKSELAEKFGISKLAVAKFAKDLGLKVTIKRKGNAKYILVDDAEEMTEIPVSNYSTF